MGWNNNGAYRSATAMDELGQHMRRIVTPAQWGTIAPLFRQANCAGGPFKVSPADTARYAEVFRAAADHPQMHVFWATSARELADVAERHARTGKPWEWF